MGLNGGSAEGSGSPTWVSPLCTNDAVSNTTVSVGTVSLGVLSACSPVRWLGWSPGAPGRGGQEVAITIKPCHRDSSFPPQTVPVCSRGASRPGGGWGDPSAPGRWPIEGGSSSTNKGSGLLGAAVPVAFGGRFPPGAPQAHSSCLINGERMKWI